jgi:anti-anti-sigma factor
MSISDHGLFDGELHGRCCVAPLRNGLWSRFFVRPPAKLMLSMSVVKWNDGDSMRMEQTELPGGIVKVKLNGALDIAGAGDIEMPFSIMSGKFNKVMVDLTGVSFLASIGIRVLMKAARTIGNRGGRFVVFNPTEEARKILRSTGIDTVIPVLADESAAKAELGNDPAR